LFSFSFISIKICGREAGAEAAAALPADEKRISLFREADYKRYAKRMQVETAEIPAHFTFFIVLTDKA